MGSATVQGRLRGRHAQLAIGHSGEAAVRDVFPAVDRAHTRRDGSIRCEVVFLRAAGVR
jgi:hypothetical protein